MSTSKDALESAREKALEIQRALDLIVGLSETRKNTVLDLTLDGGDTEVEAEKRRRECMKFVKACKNPKELHYFAWHWNWDGNIEPLEALIDNPSVDSGTLLLLFWHGGAEDYYEEYSKVSDIDKKSFDRNIFRLLLRIETKYVANQFGSNSIPFDPASTGRTGRKDFRAEFARPIPDEMYLPTPKGHQA